MQKKKIITISVVLIIYIIIMIIIIKPKEKNTILISLIGMQTEEAKKYAEENNIRLNINYEYSATQKGVLKQDIKEGTPIKKGDTITITISKFIDKEKYKNDKINELGRIPVMMYHRIVDTLDNKYTGGNVDINGYNRTAKAFREDLEYYYQNNYRMIRLIDYVNGKIDTEYGKSPIVLTFDDGNIDNIKVNGLDENGNLILDPNCAIAILEEFKKKYPDYNVTATFFVTGSLFNQPKYNEKILKFLIDNNYDIGNHTQNHNNLNNTTEEETEKVIGYVYEKLESIIGKKYVNILALPYGTPYLSSHKNFDNILNATYNGKIYQTSTTLRVGWEPDYSPFSITFNKTFIKRCRAYDNNGKDFDIKYVFENILKNNKFISDGDPNTITTSEKNEKYINQNNLYKIIY